MNYDISVGTFDESDGVARFELELNGEQIGQQLVLNDPNGSYLAQASNFRELGIASGVMLSAGDTLKITGFENLSEHARLDFLELSPVGL